MIENVGPRDRVVRALLALLLAIVATVSAGDLRIAAPAALGAVWLAGTVITARCPVYTFLHALGGRPARRRP